MLHATMVPIPRLVACVMLAALCASCAVAPCDEFAAPLDRAPGSCPVKQAAYRPTPPDQPDPKAVRYCYASLAQVDCYAEPQINRTGYLGSYQPGQTPPPAATAPATQPSSSR